MYDQVLFTYFDGSPKNKKRTVKGSAKY
jgi:hypothetical protein